MRKELFEPARIGTLEVKNRIVFLPMGTCLEEADGRITNNLIRYYERRAAGGAGLITLGVCAVHPTGLAVPPEARIYSDACAEGLAKIARVIQKNGSKASIQLHHAGRQTNSQITGMQPVAPSPIPCPLMLETPRELTTDEVREMVECYAEGARRIKEIGFDAVEFHGASGYLIYAFLSPNFNQRKDEYGGDLNNRARFAVEILRRTREKIGKDFPVIVRLCADEHLEGGLTTKDTAIIARLLEEAGADAISVTAGVYGSIHWAIPPMTQPVGCSISAAADIKKAVGIPVIAAGKISTAKLAQSVLDEGKGDFIGIGRGIVADPDLPIKLQQGREKEINRCIGCNSCLHHVFLRPPIACLINPDVIGEGIHEEKAPNRKRVLVVGAGPAGLEAARVARLRGHEVTLCERKKKIGGRWSWLINGYIQNILKVLSELDVPVKIGVRVDSDSVADFHPDAVLVTPGSRPRMPKHSGRNGDGLYTIEEALAAPQKLGDSVVVIGGGSAACEVAVALKLKGKQVTMLNDGPLVGDGLEITVRSAIIVELAQKGVKVVNGAEITGLAGSQVSWRSEDGSTGSLQADSVVSALGYEADEGLAVELRRKGIEVQTLPFCETPCDALFTVQQGAAVARRV